MLADLLPRFVGEDRQLPLYRLLDRMADESLDPKYRDLLAMSVMPFLHPRQRADLTAKPFYLMSPEEIEKVEQALRKPDTTALSAHRRAADQNAVLCVVQQKRFGEPPRRAENGRPHQRHAGNVIMKNGPAKQKAANLLEPLDG